MSTLNAPFRPESFLPLIKKNNTAPERNPRKKENEHNDGAKEKIHTSQRKNGESRSLCKKQRWSEQNGDQEEGTKLSPPIGAQNRK